MPANSTKSDVILRRLRRSGGATIAQLEKTTGWKPHSIRAAISGLRKKGHDVVRLKKQTGASRYHIARNA